MTDFLNVISTERNCRHHPVMAELKQDQQGPPSHEIRSVFLSDPLVPLVVDAFF
jgi:hypothetical protein